MNHIPTPQQEMNYHLDRIASALESIAETDRLAYEISVDTVAKTNSFTDEAGAVLSRLFTSPLFSDGEDEPE